MDVQVLLDGRGADPQEAAACVATVLRAVQHVEWVHASDQIRLVLGDTFGESVALAQQLRTDVPVVVISPRVVFAAGALRRTVKHTLGDGRMVTRIFIPGLSEDQQVTCWSPAWLRSYAGGPADLIDVGLAFDREHLPHGSPTARSWVRADELGIGLASDVKEKVWVWAARTGAELEVKQAWAEWVRAPAGRARRRLARRRQRRDQSSRL